MNWNSTIESSIKAIVSIRFAQPVAFDTEQSTTSEASGFVIDHHLGLILTNRHVACSGPFIGDAIFHDHEEVEVFPIYRDPIHDFGFLKFNPKKIKYMKLQSINLNPTKAKVGLEIKVVGNDAGEKLSILSGSISRLNRNAPDYGDLTYNDFNTFYLQAASSTSGGSSGSPVLDIEGEAVALQAGGSTRAATDFFLPLDRIKRAFLLLKQNKQVSRGTIQTHFVHRPFDECRRLGLTEEVESMVRGVDKTEVGMLGVEAVVPKGPGFGFLEEGDLLIKVEGQVVTGFVPLESFLDDNVGKKLNFTIQRGSVTMDFLIPIQDLHSITPDRYISFSGATVNTLSYQLARQFCIPVQGVYLAQPGGTLKLNGQHGSIICSIDSKQTNNLEEFLEVAKGLPDKERVAVEYFSVCDVHLKEVAIFSVDRHWSGLNLSIRNDATGLWDLTQFKDYLPATRIVKELVCFPELDKSLGDARGLFRAIVKVNFFMPIRLDGFPRSKKQGAGLVLDSKNGIVVVGRNIIPFDLGDATITIADSVIIPAEILFLHPTFNFAFVKYDPSNLLDNGKNESNGLEEAKISSVELKQGNTVQLVAFNHNLRPICVKTTVSDISPMTIPSNANPRWRAINFEGITIDTPLSANCSSGVLCDASGKVQGLWSSFMGEKNQNGHDNEYHLGFSISSVYRVYKKLMRSGVEGKVLVEGLGVEVSTVSISQSRQMGVTSEWVKKIEKANPSRPQLFMIQKVQNVINPSEPDDLNSTTKEESLKELDLVLSIEDKLVSKTSDWEPGFFSSSSSNDEQPPPSSSSSLTTTLSDHHHLFSNKKSVKMQIIRQKNLLTINVPTIKFDEQDRLLLVFWSGAIFHSPHRAVLQQFNRPLPSSVYIGGRTRGSPAFMYGLANTQFLTSFDGRKVANMDDFVAAIKENTNSKKAIVANGKDVGGEGGTTEMNTRSRKRQKLDRKEEEEREVCSWYVRVGLVSFDLIPSVISVKVNTHYWPSCVIRRDGGSENGWTKTLI